MDEQVTPIFRQSYGRIWIGATVALVAVSTLGLFSGHGIAKRIAGNRGDSMNSLRLTRFHTAKTFLDLTSVANSDGVRFLTVEHLYQSSNPWRDTPTEKTTWRFWDCPEPGKPFRQASENVVSLPGASALSAALAGGSLALLLETNREHAAYLGIWKIADPKRLGVLEESVSSLPLDLDEATGSQVQIDLRDEWSTAQLRPVRWLFNPSMAALSNEYVIAMNTADARAVLWESKGTTSAKRVLAFLPEALDPMVVAGGSKILLFYRKPTPRWSVYFHNARFSGSYGPVALPLMLVELDKEGHMLRSVNLSEQRGLGGVFAFSVSAAQGGFLLTTISGLKEKPKLQLYSSGDLGQTLQVSGSADLPDVPYRLSIAANESRGVVGVVYKQAEGYQVEGACWAIPK